jgi:hypothetical protein
LCVRALAAASLLLAAIACGSPQERDWDQESWLLLVFDVSPETVNAVLKIKDAALLIGPPLN